MTLPMEKGFVDGVILVHGSRRVVFFAFIERDKEEVQLFVFEVHDALAQGARFVIIEGGADLVARIMAMQVKRRVKTDGHGFVDEIDVLVIILQYFEDFGEEGWVARQDGKAFRKRVEAAAGYVVLVDRKMQHLP